MIYGTSYTNIKQQIKTEFDWLTNQYPTEGFQVEKLLILNSKEHKQLFALDEEYNELDLSGYVFDTLSSHACKFQIVLIINKCYQLDEQDSNMLKRHSVHPHHLPHWILFHEYGHIMDFHQVFKKKGIRALQKYATKTEKEIERVYKKFTNNEISYSEMNVLYKQTTSEKNADEFAMRFYKERKSLLGGDSFESKKRD